MKDYLYDLVERIGWALVEAVNMSEHRQQQWETLCDEDTDQGTPPYEDDDQGCAW